MKATEFLDGLNKLIVKHKERAGLTGGLRVFPTPGGEKVRVEYGEDDSFAADLVELAKGLLPKTTTTKKKVTKKRASRRGTTQSTSAE